MPVMRGGRVRGAGDERREGNIPGEQRSWACQ